jgi:hypothetical protein
VENFLFYSTVGHDEQQIIYILFLLVISKALGAIFLLTFNYEVNIVMKADHRQIGLKCNQDMSGFS